MKFIPRICLTILTGGLVAFPTAAQDVAAVSLVRSGNFQQVSEGEPQPTPPTDDSSPFSCFSVMEMSEAFLSDPDNLDFVRGVTLQPPTGSLRGMDFYEIFGGFVYFQDFTSQAALESAFRAGNYRFTFSSFLTGDEVSLIGVPETALPTAPRVLNFPAAQQVDPAQSFTLSWTPASPENGGAQLEVYDWETGAPVYDSGPLLGAVAAAEIPAGILQPGKSYQAELTASRFDAFDPDNVPTRSAYSNVTTVLLLKTGSGGGGTLAITSIAQEPVGSVTFTIDCQPGVPLELQRATALGSNWETVQTVTPDSSPAILILPLTDLGNASFFQAAQ